MSEENKSRLEGAIEQLRNHQTQLDADGIMVGVSREALDMALAALSAPKAEAVTVKPLEWEGGGYWSHGPDDGWMEEANTAFGWGYSIEFGRDGNFKVDSTFEWSQDGFETPEAAKAAAQADYEARILSAIATSPVPALTDEAVERAVEAIEGELGGVSATREQARTILEYALLAAFPSKGGE